MKKGQNKIDVIKFGNRVQQIREEILGMTQSELAEKINSSQVLLSRLERGVGGNIHLVFDIVNYLNSRNISAQVLFIENFSINLVRKKNASVSQPSQLEEVVKELQKTINSDLEKLKLLLSIER